MTGLTIRQYNEWTNSNHKEPPIASGTFDSIIEASWLPLKFFGVSFFGVSPSALSRWRQCFFKGRQLERAEEQQARGLQLSGWTTTPDQTKSYLRKGGRMKSILPSAVFFSADSPSQSWSGKRRKLKFGFFQPSGLKEISITQRAEQKLEE